MTIIAIMEAYLAELLRARATAHPTYVQLINDAILDVRRLLNRAKEFK
jgi:hypothetical protein